MCDLAFRCGCSDIWAGGIATCNFNLPGVPHCPWCEHAWLGASGFGIATGLSFVVFRWALRRGEPGWRAAVVALVAVAPAQMVGAGATWLATDYPHWLARDARRTLSMPAGPIMCGPVRPPEEPVGEPRRP